MHSKRSLPSENFPPTGCCWLGRALALVRQQPRSPNPLHSDSSLPFSFVEKLPLFFGLDQQHQKPTSSTAPPTSSQPPPLPSLKSDLGREKEEKKCVPPRAALARRTGRQAGMGRGIVLVSSGLEALGRLAAGEEGVGKAQRTDGGRRPKEGLDKLAVSSPGHVLSTSQSLPHPIHLRRRSELARACLCLSCGRLG